jgi:ribonuclease D
MAVTLDRIQQLRTLAESHKASRRSARIILECLDELDRVQELYCLALDAAYLRFPKKQTALKKLKGLVNQNGAHG